jgi:spore cortex protein
MLTFRRRGGSFLQQHRKTWMLPALLCIGLAGCGTKNESAYKNTEIQSTPIGYYSNEKHDKNGETVTIINRDNNVDSQMMLNGNDNDGPRAVINSHDNDGPLVELLDHSFGAKGQQNNNNQNTVQRNNNQNTVQRNNIRAQENNRQGATIQSNFDNSLIGASDRNYHGHLANNRIPSGKTTYNRENEGNLSSWINQTVEKVDNVKASETIIQDQNIIIGVLLEKNENVAETKRNIQKVIGSQVRDRKVQVFTNQSQYNSIKVMNNDLKNGGPAVDIENELKNIVDIDNR